MREHLPNQVPFNPDQLANEAMGFYDTEAPDPAAVTRKTTAEPTAEQIEDLFDIESLEKEIRKNFGARRDREQLFEPGLFDEISPTDFNADWF